MKTVNKDFDPRGLLAKVRPIDKPGNTASNSAGSMPMASPKPESVPTDELDAKYRHHKTMAQKAPTLASRKLHKKLAEHFEEKCEATHMKDADEDSE